MVRQLARFRKRDRGQVYRRGQHPLPLRHPPPTTRLGFSYRGLSHAAFVEEVPPGMARADEVLRLLGSEADLHQRVRDQVWAGNACTGGSRCDRFCSFPAQISPGLPGANWVPLPPASRHRTGALCCGLLVGDGLSRRLLGRDHDVFRVDRSDGLQGLRPWDRGLHVPQRVDELHVHRGSVRRVCQRFSQVLYRLSVRGDPLADLPGDCPCLAPQLSPGHALCSVHVLLRAANGGSSRQAHRGHVEGLHHTG
mmetsp:Transcript_22521/g.53116  ORF Transcript_22521/g.53116 Transcript_22521/m.53116 type:complete len:252 (+) Transcript_22521:267-1022(+)